MKSLFLALFLFPFLVNAQSNYADNSEEFGEVYFAADERPYIANCDHQLSSAPNYKSECTKTRLQRMVWEMLKDQITEGTLVIDMIIDKNGKIVNIELPGTSVTEDRSSALSAMQHELMTDVQFTPAKNQGKKVAHQFSVSVYLGPGEG